MAPEHELPGLLCVYRDVMGFAGELSAAEHFVRLPEWCIAGDVTASRWRDCRSHRLRWHGLPAIGEGPRHPRQSGKGLSPDCHAVRRHPLLSSVAWDRSSEADFHAAIIRGRMRWSLPTPTKAPSGGDGPSSMGAMVTGEDGRALFSMLVSRHPFFQTDGRNVWLAICVCLAEAMATRTEVDHKSGLRMSANCMGRSHFDGRMGVMYPELVRDIMVDVAEPHQPYRGSRSIRRGHGKV
jgi:hypothetical protein